MTRVGPVVIALSPQGTLSRCTRLRTHKHMCLLIHTLTFRQFIYLAGTYAMKTYCHKDVCLLLLNLTLHYSTHCTALQCHWIIEMNDLN